MDVLTFGCSKMYKGLKSKTNPVTEVSLGPALDELGLKYKEFVDFCILCGCDYTGSIASNFSIFKN